MRIFTPKKKYKWKNYARYIRSSTWQNKKWYYPNARKPLHCLICRNPNYQLHHLHYDNLGYESYETDLIPLCQSCHGRLHEFLNQKGLNVRDSLWAIRECFGLSSKQIGIYFKKYPKLLRIIHKKPPSMALKTQELRESDGIKSIEN